MIVLKAEAHWLVNIGDKWRVYEISGFRHEVAENYALLSYYAASGGNFLPTFRDNLSASS